MTLRDDPMLTAYALGEFDEARRTEIERALATDPESRAAVEEVRRTAALLGRALALEEAGTPPIDRASVLRRAAGGAPVVALRRRRWVSVARWGSVAAAALLVAGIAMAPRKGGGGGALGTTRADRGVAAGYGTSRPSSTYGPAVGLPALTGLPSPAAADRGVLPGGPGVPPPASGPAGSGSVVGAELAEGTAARGATGEAAPGTEAYARVVESAYALARAQPLSTFSVDVDTASYANVRRFLEQGQMPPPEAVRVEEMVNYFRYDDPPPTGEHPIAVRVEAAACPWALDHRLVRVALSTREVERKARPAMNLVFLIDVSGSMGEPEKLPLVQASMRMLLDELNERDTVAIVTYAGESGVRLPPTSCEKRREIANVIDGLTAGGSTNGASGISLAYAAAASAMKRGGVNRVILCTDGDFNVGVTSHADLLALIRAKAKSGVFLTVLGYGTGNLKDDTLELLADEGNGAYGYVDSTREAHRILVEQAGGTLVTVAKDVKVQVEFNPAVVSAYRLVGYEDRLLAAKDFKDDAKDAGEVGAGHHVTAFYEVVPVGKAIVPGNADLDPLKYAAGAEAGASPPSAAPAGAAGDVSRETLTVKVRYKPPAAAASVPMEVALTDPGTSYDRASPDFKFAAAVAAFGQVLRRSPHRGTATLDGVEELAGEGLGFDPDGRRKEFVGLVAKAKALAPPAPLPPPVPATVPLAPGR